MILSGFVVASCGIVWVYKLLFFSRREMIKNCFKVFLDVSKIRPGFCCNLRVTFEVQKLSFSLDAGRVKGVHKGAVNWSLCRKFVLIDTLNWKVVEPIQKRPDVCFVSGPETVGYDWYPVVRISLWNRHREPIWKRQPYPEIISGSRISQEEGRTRRVEPVWQYCLRIFPGNPLNPAVSSRTALSSVYSITPSK